MKKVFATLVMALFMSLAPARAATPQVQGRWEFVTLTGDTSAQLNNSGQSVMSTYLLQSGSAITNIVPLTTDAYLDDQVGYNNDVITGTANNNGTVTLKLVITNSPTNKVTLNFTGTVSTYTQHGANATVLTGTYTSDGQYTTGGNFVATFFPDFTGQAYSGALDGPDTGSGPVEVPASFTMAMNADHTLKVTNFTVSAPLAACFVPPFHTINDPNYPAIPTNASGMGISIYLQDSVGGKIWLNGYSILADGKNTAALDEVYGDGTAYPNNGLGAVGTNNTYEVYYGITTNNSCNGLGGGDAPFQVQIPKHHRGDRYRKDDGHDRRHRR